MAQNYNDIYEKLVTDESDMVGHIAYSLYKRKKQEYIKEWKKKHFYQDITKEALVDFHTSESTEAALKQYKDTANSILQKFMNNVLRTETNEIMNRCNTRQTQTLQAIIAPLKPSPIWKQYHHGAFQSAIGSFVFALLIALFSVVLYFGKGSLPITIVFGNEQEVSETSGQTSNQ